MFSKRPSQHGVTLIEMIVSIVLFGAMAAVGSLLISKLAPSYIAGVQAEQALSPREAALWRLSEDFRRSLIEETQWDQASCTLSMVVASGVTGANSAVVVSQEGVYRWLSGSKQLWLSAPWISSVNGLLLDNVIPTDGVCPFNYVSGIGTVSRTQLNVAFQYSTGGYESVVIPVSMALRSYANGPYVASAVLTGNTTVSSVSISGYFPGMPSIISSVTFVAGAVPISSILTAATNSSVTANVSYVASTYVDIKVTTPEGWSTLKNAFQFPP